MNEPKSHNFKNLKIWQLSMDIANDVWNVLEHFPQLEKYDLRSQISRCSISIP